jgi:arylsulfatase A-like enzyme
VRADLEALTDARTGKPMVTGILRTRADAFQATRPGDRPSDADMIVMWSNTPSDIVDHPKAGRIGPVPFKRSGSHVHRGFFMARGRHIAAGTRLTENHALDLAPTIVAELGAPMPPHFDGRPILEKVYPELEEAVS